MIKCCFLKGKTMNNSISTICVKIFAIARRLNQYVDPFLHDSTVDITDSKMKTVYKNLKSIKQQVIQIQAGDLEKSLIIGELFESFLSQLNNIVSTSRGMSSGGSITRLDIALFLSFEDQITTILQVIDNNRNISEFSNIYQLFRTAFINLSNQTSSMGKLHDEKIVLNLIGDCNPTLLAMQEHAMGIKNISRKTLRQFYSDLYALQNNDNIRSQVQKLDNHIQQKQESDCIQVLLQIIKLEIHNLLEVKIDFGSTIQQLNNDPKKFIIIAEKLESAFSYEENKSGEKIFSENLYLAPFVTDSMIYKIMFLFIHAKKDLSQQEKSDLIGEIQVLLQTQKCKTQLNTDESDKNELKRIARIIPQKIRIMYGFNTGPR
jgi:hypothetical protein